MLLEAAFPVDAVLLTLSVASRTSIRKRPRISAMSFISWSAQPSLSASLIREQPPIIAGRRGSLDKRVSRPCLRSGVQRKSKLEQREQAK